MVGDLHAGGAVMWIGGDFVMLVIEPVFPLPVAVSAVKLTVPKSARAWPAGTPPSVSSTIHSALLWAGGGVGEATGVVEVQPFVVSVSAISKLEPERLTEAVNASPGATG